MSRMPGARIALAGPWELAIVTTLAWLALIAISALWAPMGLAWDALNHHIYLGWMADGSRLHEDFLAAGYQSLTYPYLYWPVYKLASAGVGPVVAGMVLVTLHTISVPAVWLIARNCMPGTALIDAAMRAMAVLLALLSGVVLSQLDSSSNDSLAGAPLVWSIALALEALRPERAPAQRKLLIASGLLAGAAVAFKLSNGPMAIVMPFLWVFAGTTSRERMFNTALACVATVFGLVVAYGYWGVQLWSHFGNPIYPFYDYAFAPLRAMTGLTP